MSRFSRVFEETVLRSPKCSAAYLDSLPEPSANYVILFTPRSGSTWLTEILTETDLMGIPDEFFNCALIPGTLSNFPPTSPRQYVEWVKKFTQRGGVFGTQITYFDLLLVEECLDFFEAIAPKNVFVLSRKDFVAQAVSLYIATETQYFHSHDLPSSKAVDFDGEKIKTWCKHILQQEYGIETVIRHRSLSPYRFTYEELLVNTHQAVLSLIGVVHGDTAYPHSIVGTGKLKKIATTKNAEFAQLFNREYFDFVAFWTNHRGTMSCL